MRVRSPFPGMDPWLERYWSSVHHRVISNFADQIQSQLPQGLFADVEVTVYISADEEDQANVIPDVSVLEKQPAWGDVASQSAHSELAVATPYLIQIPSEAVELGHVVIRSLKDHEPLVTAIELFSPTNKIDHRGRAAYLAKREQYYQAKANLVEVDLLRGGAELVDVRPDDVPTNLVTPYKAVVRRVYRRKQAAAEYYAMPLRESLPRIAIPLRRNDLDVVLDFQSAINQTYEGGRYGERIDYNKPPSPMLDAKEMQWAMNLLADPTGKHGK